MNEQSVLFPTDDFSDRTFELKRAQKAVRKEQIHGHTDLIVVLPYTHMAKEFAVSRMTSGRWSCQACLRNPACSHIRKIRKLLQLKKEAGYEMSDSKWLEQVLVVGQVK